jgi:cardiolipin synthase
MTIGPLHFTVLGMLEFFGILTAVHSIMNTRTAQGAIAWSFALVTIPIVSVPLYWIFGRNRFEGYLVARHEGATFTQQLVRERLVEFDSRFGTRFEDDRGRFEICEKLANLPFSKGNRVELLVDGDATFAAILEGIRSAETYVLVQFFIIHDDQIGRQLKDTLISKAKEGIRIYLVYDEIGSHELPKSYLNELTAAGAEAYSFHSTRGILNRFQLNFRNHRKIVIVDGQTAYLGGHNVGDEYLGRDPKFGHWRDTHVKLEGPCVPCVQLAFLEDWNWSTEHIIQNLHWSDHCIEHQPGQDVLILPTGPADELSSCGLMFVQLINAARHRCWITTPYYIPSDEVYAALQLAVLRGVDVRILVPDSIDHLLVYLSSWSFINTSLKSGVRFFRYENGFLHQKVILIDDDFAAVGTANLDNRSFRLNFEITAAVADREFAGEVEQMLQTDFAAAREMQAGELSRKPYYFRLACEASRLLAPIQ